MTVAVSDLKSKVLSVLEKDYGFDMDSEKTKIISIRNSTATIKAEGRDGPEILKVYSPVFLENFKDWSTNFLDFAKLRDRELEILSMLNHPNLPRLTNKISFALKDESELEFENIVACINFFEAKNLRSLIADGRRLSEGDSRIILKDVLSALSYLQSDPRRAVVHRDIKPENILFDSKNAYLIDFNFSAFLDSEEVITNRGSTMIWSFGYYPAELYKFQKNLSMDLFALGRTVVSSMYGTDIMSLCRGDFEAKLDLRPLDVSSDLKWFLEKLTEPKVKGRFENASQALEVLDNLDRMNLWTKKFSIPNPFNGNGKTSDQLRIEAELEKAKLKEAESEIIELRKLLDGANDSIKSIKSDVSAKDCALSNEISKLGGLSEQFEKTQHEVAIMVAKLRGATEDFTDLSVALPEAQQKLSEIKEKVSLVLGDQSLIQVASNLPSMDELNKFDNVGDISSLLRLLESEKFNLLRTSEDVRRYIRQLNDCARKLYNTNFSLPSNFDVSKIVFTYYSSSDGIRAAFEQRRHSQRKTILLSLPLIALLRGLDADFSSSLWKERGSLKWCHAVSEWLAMPAKNSRGDARVVVSHGLNGYFFEDSSRMPNGGIGVLSEESFYERFEAGITFEEFRKNGIDLFSPSSIRLEGRDAEAFLKLRGRYLLGELEETPIDILLGNKQILERYFETAKNTAYNKNQDDDQISVHIEHSEPASGACGGVACLNIGGIIEAGNFEDDGRFVGVLPGAFEQIKSACFNSF